MKRTLLFLSADTFQASVWSGSDFSAAKTFSNDADGRESFALYLENNPQPAYLMVDVIEEDFHHETVPHLSGSSRTALFDRKFEQYYRSTPFRQATLVKRQDEGRRDDEILFSALTNPQRISPWLDTLHAQKTPLVGIYSVPNVSTQLVQAIPSEHLLLLSWEKDAGLRQTYFNNKRLHFSRLTPTNQNSSFSAAVAAETPRTQQYLKSLSLPPPGEVLDIQVLCHASDKKELEALLEGDSNLKYSLIDIEHFAVAHSCKHQFTDSDATPLFLSLLAKKPPTSHYANGEHTHFYLLWKLRKALFGLAILTLLIGIAWGGATVVESWQLNEATLPLNENKTKVQQQTQQVQSGFANTTIPAADMKSAVLLARSLSQYSPPPKEVIGGLSLVMNNFPRITLRNLAWQSSAADAPPSPYPAQVITFEGSLNEFGTDHRKALTYLEQFQQALTQRGYTVSTVILPLDVTSQGSINGDSTNVKNKGADFTLKIIWRQPS
jgi:hypothetical protein